MLDVRPTAFVAPLLEVPWDDVLPIVRVTNFADEPGTVTAFFRIYRDSTGVLEYHSVITPTLVNPGETVDIPALTAYAPGAPADDDYWVMVETLATNPLVPNLCTGLLGPQYFDVKPGPMGPPPAAHHTTHEDGGADPVDATGLVCDSSIVASQAWVSNQLSTPLSKVIAMAIALGG